MLTVTTRAESSATPEQRIIRWCLAAFVALVAAKFLVILADAGWDLAKSPYGLLVVIVVPAVLLALLVDRRPRAGALVVTVAMLVWIVTVVSALLRDGFTRGSAADYLFAYGGMAVALVAIGASVSLWRSRDAREEPPVPHPT